MAKGYIYIFTNPSFKQYVKIGYSEDVQKRLEDANRSTWTPKTFRLYGTYATEEASADKALHSLIEILDDKIRVSESVKGRIRKREFFEMSPEKAWSILENLASISGTTDCLEKNDKWTSEEMMEDADSSEEPTSFKKTSSSRFNFAYCGIPVGSVLTFKYDGSVTLTVRSDSDVDYQGHRYSLTKLGKKLMSERTGNVWHTCQGPAYFCYNGKLLTDIKAEKDAMEKTQTEVGDEDEPD